MQSLKTNNNEAGQVPSFISQHPHYHDMIEILRDYKEAHKSATVRSIIHRMKRDGHDVGKMLSDARIFYQLSTESKDLELVYCILNPSERATCSSMRFASYYEGYVFCKTHCECSLNYRKSCLREKYGVESHWDIPGVREKAQKTFMDKYGTSNLHEINIEKKRQTNNERYGAPTPLESSTVLQKTRDSFHQRYGSFTPFEVESIQVGIQERWLGINGKRSYVRTTQQNKEIHQKLLSSKFGDKSEYLVCPDRLTELLSTVSRDKASDIIGCSISLIDKRVAEWGLTEFQTESYYEVMITSFLDELGIQYVRNTRKVIAPKELDIYIPSHKIAIEFNGLHWHSENLGKKDRRYHLSKTESCEAIGIRLIHIFQDEWDNKSDIVKSILRNALGKTHEFIYARKCEIREISSSEYKNFMDINHLQGSNIGTSIRVGLYYNGSLVSAMSFKKTKLGVELSRLVSKLNTTVIGAAKRLFTFAKKNYTLTDLYTYSDRRYFAGNVYSELGFTFDSYTSPSYHYFLSANRRYDRTHFMKKNLSRMLVNYQPELSEWENMKMNGYDRIWDCGHTKWVMVVTDE